MTARTPEAHRWLLAACALAGCFVDGGLQTGSGGGVTSAGATSSGTTGAPATDGTTAIDSGSTGAPETTAAATTTGLPPPTCGNDIIEAPLEECDDGNLDDTDACLSTCQDASCGDGIVWAGVEACDDGPGNSTAPDATCRPDCTLPTCGDGGLYVGPLGPPIPVTNSSAQFSQGNDAPRSIAADGSGEFLVQWRVDGQGDQVLAQRIAADGTLLGGPTNYQTQQATDIRDPAIAASQSGDVAAVFEHGPNVTLSLRLGGGSPQLTTANTLPLFTVNSPTVALGPSKQAAVAFLVETNNNTRAVSARLFLDLQAPDKAASEAAVSAHIVGVATPPTVGFWPTGDFFVAWGDPTGPLLYRRYTPAGQPGAQVQSNLVLGAPDQAVYSPWTGAAARPDGSLVLAGLDGGGRLALQRFDPGDGPQAPVLTDEQDPRLVPFVDLASDPWGNLAVAWSACGSLLDPDIANCTNLPQRWRLQWFRADLTAAGPSEQVVEAGMPSSPVSVTVAPTGRGAVTYMTQNRVEARISALNCP